MKIWFSRFEHSFGLKHFFPETMILDASAILMSGRNSKYYCKKAIGRARPWMTKFVCHDGSGRFARATAKLQRCESHQSTRNDPLRRPGCTRRPDSSCIVRYLGITQSRAQIRRDLRVDFRGLGQSLELLQSVGVSNGHIRMC